LRQWRIGTLDGQMPDGSQAHFGGAVDAGSPRAAIRLHDWSVCAAALKSGDIGFAESYIAGDWSTPDLTALLKLFIANREHIESAMSGDHVFDGFLSTSSSREAKAAIKKLLEDLNDGTDPEGLDISKELSPYLG